jgi:hypothetical protein
MRVTAKVSYLVLSVALAGCAVFDPDLLPAQKEDPGTPPEATCGRQPPPQPATSDPGEDVGFMLFAMRGVVLDQRGVGRSWSEIGYDLDCYITNNARDVIPDRQECVPPNALPPPEGGFTVDMPPEPLSLDGVDGIDNVFGDKFYPLVEASVNQTLQDYFGENRTFESVANEAQEAGKGTLLLGVEHWNGQLNDRRMTVWIAQAAGGTPCSEKDLVEFNEEFELVYIADPETLAPPPQWDGNDCWWLRSDAFIQGSMPPQLRIMDDLAYMAQVNIDGQPRGQAVMKIQDREPIEFFAGPVGARTILTGAVSTAVIEGDLSDLSSVKLVNNIVAGRWQLTDLTQSATHVGVCGSAQWVLQNQLDSMADVRSNASDPHALDQPCNAISMGVRFEEGVRGQLAGMDPADSRATGAPLPVLCPES